MPKINDIDNMTQAMRDGALRLVIANYVENGESFSKYDVTSGVRSLLAMIADFTHADVRELIGEEMLNMVKSGLQYGDSIVDGPTGEYVLYAPSTPLATEDDSEDAEEEVTLDQFDKLWIELIEKAIESDINVVKYNTNTYKIAFDSGVFILIMVNGGDQTFNRATVHTASGQETGSFKTLKDMCDNINEFMQPDIQKIVNSLNPQSSMADAVEAITQMIDTDSVDDGNNWLNDIKDAFTKAGYTPLDISELDVSYMDSDCFYVVLERDADGEDKFVVTVVTSDDDGFIAGYLHQYGAGVVSALTLDDLVAETDVFLTDYKAAEADVAVPVTPKTSRVYISKLYCDDAGFVAGTKLKISTKNQRVVAITQAKDDDYNYTVNADGRIRISSNYLEAIGLSEDTMKITAYNGMIMLSNVG